jgi:hypothetical protein
MASTLTGRIKLDSDEVKSSRPRAGSWRAAIRTPASPGGIAADLCGRRVLCKGGDTATRRGSGAAQCER